jgi:hypothetical protein
MFNHDGNHGAPMGRRVQGISLSRRQQAHRWENARCDGRYFFSSSPRLKTKRPNWHKTLAAVNQFRNVNASGVAVNGKKG